MTCPCGCGGHVKEGNTYAAKGCGLRLRHRHRPYNVHAIHRQRTGHASVTTPDALSWWTQGMSREQFRQQAEARFSA